MSGSLTYGEPSRLIGVVAVVISGIGMFISLLTCWIGRFIPIFSASMSWKEDRQFISHRPRASSESRQRSLTASDSRRQKRVSFSDNEGCGSDGRPGSREGSHRPTTESQPASPRSSFSSNCSAASSFSTCSASTSKSVTDPFLSTASVPRFTGLFQRTDSSNAIRIPNIMKLKRRRSSSFSSVSDCGSPTPGPISAPPISGLQEQSKPRLRSRSPTQLTDRAAKMKPVSEDSGELFYSGFENPLKALKRRSTGSSRIRLGEKVHKLLSGSSSDPADKDSITSASSASSQVSSDKSKSSRHRKSRSLMMYMNNKLHSRQSPRTDPYGPLYNAPTPLQA